MTKSQNSSPSLKNKTPNSPPQSVSKCGSGAIIGVRKDSPVAVIIPTTCKSWWCTKCKIPKSLRLIERICTGDPERMITLTSNPAASLSPTDAVNLMKAGWVRLLRKIKKTFAPFEYVLIWERTKRGWPHIHAAVRGSYIPHAWLKYWWKVYTSAPIVHITKINSERHAARYLAKYFIKDQGPILRLLGRRKIVQFSKAWSLRDPKSTAHLVASDFKWYRLNAGTAVSVAEMIRHHHQLFDPNGKNNVSWFSLSPTSVLPGTDGRNWEALFALPKLPYNCHSPPPPSLAARPTQVDFLFDGEF
ncbi:hypothetical protein ES705_32331 [subsurface metagenome]